MKLDAYFRVTGVIHTWIYGCVSIFNFVVCFFRLQTFMKLPSRNILSVIYLHCKIITFSNEYTRFSNIIGYVRKKMVCLIFSLESRVLSNWHICNLCFYIPDRNVFIGWRTPVCSLRQCISSLEKVRSLFYLLAAICNIRCTISFLWQEYWVKWLQK